MNKEDVLNAVMKADVDAVHALADTIRNQYPIEIICWPECGLYLSRGEESMTPQHSRSGKVMMTTSCEVRLYDKTGYALIAGINHLHALDCAILMAVIETELPEKSDVLALARGLGKVLEVSCN